jgi:polar amino acid transport system substrate-binding protein
MIYSNENLTPIAKEIAPHNILRVALNLANFLLVNLDQDKEPIGIAPSLALEIAKKLNIDLQFLPYATPGEIAEDAQKDIWDMALLAIEPARAEVIDFSSAYLEIESTYLVPARSSIMGIDEVDQPGVRIAVMEKSAYDLFLSRSIKHAQLIRSKSMDESFDVFVSDKLEVLAGLKPRLIQEQQRLEGSKILPGRFTAVQQAMGLPKGSQLGINFIRSFVLEAVRSGHVEKIIKTHGIQGVNVAQ